MKNWLVLVPRKETATSQFHFPPIKSGMSGTKLNTKQMTTFCIDYLILLNIPNHTTSLADEKRILILSDDYGLLDTKKSFYWNFVGQIDRLVSIL